MSVIKQLDRQNVSSTSAESDLGSRIDSARTTLDRQSSFPSQKMGEVGFEPTKAKPTDLQSVLVDHLSIRPEMSAASERCSDAGRGVYRRSGSAAILGSGGNRESGSRLGTIEVSLVVRLSRCRDPCRVLLIRLS